MTDFIFLQVIDLAIDRGDIPFLIGVWQSRKEYRSYIENNLSRLSQVLRIPIIDNFVRLITSYYGAMVDQKGLKFETEDYAELLSYVVEVDSVGFARYVLDQLIVIIDGGDLPIDPAEDLSEAIEKAALNSIKQAKNDLFYVLYDYHRFVNESIEQEIDHDRYLETAVRSNNEEVIKFLSEIVDT